MINDITLLRADTHLGFGENTAKWLLAILPQYEFERIIFVGDTFHHFRFEEFSRDELKFMTWLCDLGPEVEVVVIPGNHDHDLPLGLAVLSQGNFQIIQGGLYAWEYQGKSYVAIHGDQFDDSLEQDKLWQDFLYWWELRIRAADRVIDVFTGRWQLLLSQFFRHPYWLERIEDLSFKAMEFAKTQNYDCIFCGHVHQPAVFKAPLEIHDDKDTNPVYVNLGCWIDSDPTLSISSSINTGFFVPAFLIP